MNAALGDVSITLVYTTAADEQKQTICHMDDQQQEWTLRKLSVRIKRMPGQVG